MKIDITRWPPADLSRERGRHTGLAAFFLLLSLGGVGLMLFAILSDTPHSDTLETAALALFVAPSVGVSYYGGKVNGYKGLNDAQEKDLIGLAAKYPEIASYRDRLERIGRKPVYAEYQACREWSEKRGG